MYKPCYKYKNGHFSASVCIFFFSLNCSDRICQVRDGIFLSKYFAMPILVNIHPSVILCLNVLSDRGDQFDAENVFHSSSSNSMMLMLIVYILVLKSDFA